MRCRICAARCELRLGEGCAAASLSGFGEQLDSARPEGLRQIEQSVPLAQDAGEDVRRRGERLLVGRAGHGHGRCSLLAAKGAAARYDRDVVDPYRVTPPVPPDPYAAAWA